MKFLIPFLVSFLVRGLLAQNITGLPNCGQYCVNQVSALAVAQARCNENHANCYCTRGDFVNAVNTCANTQCTSDTDKSIVSAFANGFCGVDAKTNPSGSATSTAGPATASPTASQASQASTSTATPSPKSSSSLSGGAIAGIAIGVVAALLLVAGLAFFLIRRRRATARNRSDGEYFHEVDASGAVAKKGAAEKLAAKELWVPPVVHELPGTEGIRNPSTPGAGESPAVERASPDVSPETQNVSPVGGVARPAESRS